MEDSIQYWITLYERLKSQSLCLDIETTHFGGPIAIVGTYAPKDGEIQYNALVKSQNLSQESLRSLFSDCKLLITYNGHAFDIPKINQEFPGAIPHETKILDVYQLAKKLGLGTNLKVLESTLNIERMSGDHKGKAVLLWQRYVQYNDNTALQLLLDYNRQDVINLYPIMEEIRKRALQLNFNTHL